jgi:hypothetical protein
LPTFVAPAYDVVNGTGIFNTERPCHARPHITGQTANATIFTYSSLTPFPFSPMNIYEVTTKVFEFVLDDPFSGSTNHPLVASDISDGTAFNSL